MFKWPIISEKDLKSIYIQLKDWINIFDWGWIYEIFRNKISNFFSKDYVILTNNGTSALFLAYNSIWLKEWDEVISFTYTHHSTNSLLLKIWVNLILCDSDKYWVISLDEIKKRINKNTKLLVLPYTWWYCPDIDEILKLKSKYNFFIVEDCSQAHFWQYKWKYLWTFWDIWVFSMQWWKLLSAGEWWFIITSNKDLFENMLINSDSWLWIKNQLNSDLDYMKYFETWLGYKFRPNPIWIAFANSQLDNILEKIDNRRYFAKYIIESLKNTNCFIFPEIDYNIFNPSWYWLIWIYNEDFLKIDLKSFLNECHMNWIIEIYNPIQNKPNHLLHLFQENIWFINLKNSEFIYKNAVFFPISWDMRDEEKIKYYIQKIKIIINKIKK